MSARSKKDSIDDRLKAIKDELVSEFENSGLGKDILLDVQNAIDHARTAVRSHGVSDGHDLNDDLAEKPEDHPARQGQQSTPINTDDGVNQATPDQDEDGVERRLGSDGEPHAPAPK